MAYEMVMPYHLHMPSYFLETFTEYPYAGTGGLSILSIATGLSDITPFILNLLQGGNIPATIVGACIMQAIISNIVVNMFYAIFFSSRRKEMLPYVWKGFLTVIGVNAVLLLIYYF